MVDLMEDYKTQLVVQSSSKIDADVDEAGETQWSVHKAIQETCVVACKYKYGRPKS